MLISALLFGIGLFGVIYKRNAIAVLMCVELMLNAANINFVAISKFVEMANNYVAQLFALMVIVVAAAEVAVGLALIISIYKQRKSFQVDDFNILKW